MMTGAQLMAAGVGIAVFGAVGVVAMASTALDPARRGAAGIGSAIGGVVFYELVAVFGIWARELGANRKARFAPTQGQDDTVRDGTNPLPQTPKTRTWYKKKSILFPLGLVPLLIPIGVFSLAGQATATAPNVVGMRLDFAHNALKAADLPTFQEVDVIGTGRSVMLDHNWVVLVQSPAAGTAGVKTTTEIKLSVGKVDDPEIRDRLPKDAPVMVELAAADQKASAERASAEADAAARAAKAADEEAARDAATVAAARAKAAAAATMVDPATYAPIGQRGFALVAKDPDAHAGEKYVL